MHSQSCPVCVTTTRLWPCVHALHTIGHNEMKSLTIAVPSVRAAGSKHGRRMRNIGHVHRLVKSPGRFGWRLGSAWVGAWVGEGVGENSGLCRDGLKPRTPRRQKGGARHKQNLNGRYHLWVRHGPVTGRAFFFRGAGSVSSNAQLISVCAVEIRHGLAMQDHATLTIRDRTNLTLQNNQVHSNYWSTPGLYSVKSVQSVVLFVSQNHYGLFPPAGGSSSGGVATSIARDLCGQSPRSRGCIPA